MKNLFNGIICFLAASCCTATGVARTISLKSPDKKTVLNISLDDEPLRCSATHGGKAVILPSALGFKVDGQTFGASAKLSAQPTRTRLKERYAMLGNHATAVVDGYEMVLPLSEAGMNFELIVRLYNDGFGVRYRLPQAIQHFDEEFTAWQLPDGVQQVVWEDFDQSYEGYSHVAALGDMPQGVPVMAPVTVNMGTAYLSLSESDCQDFSDMSFVCDGSRLRVVFPYAKQGWAMDDGNRKLSPWRTVVVADDLNQLVNSDLIANLCPAPSSGEDFSWVQPGRCLWQWWSVGAPQYADQRNWYDAAAKLKWEYYLIDDGWRDWRAPGKTQWDLLKEVIDYGKQKGIKTLVWADSKEFRQVDARRQYLEKVKAAGAVGIKIDFIPEPTAQVMQWYVGTMKDCQALHLLLNFHGCVKPTGLSRTYPHNLTREGVRGNEYQITRYGRVLPFSHDVSLPFTRPLAGATDYTPVIFDPAQLTTKPYSWTHEFAQAIIYMSPITHFCDHYNFYLNSPMLDLLQDVPTVWDETRVLPLTQMGTVVAYARRKGDCWWIGVMNGGESSDLSLPLDFLKKKAHAKLVFDGETPTSVRRQEGEYTRQDVLKLSLKPGGGFVARLQYVQ